MAKLSPAWLVVLAACAGAPSATPAASRELVVVPDGGPLAIADAAPEATSYLEAGDGVAADVVATDASTVAEARAPVETAETWLARRGVVAPADPEEPYRCSGSAPCPEQCKTWWTTASGVDFIACAKVIGFATLRRPDIDDHRMMSSVVVYRVEQGALHPVLTLPFSDEDIEVTGANVQLTLDHAPDGLTLRVSEVGHDRCADIDNVRTQLQHENFPLDYARTVEQRDRKVCASIGSYRWNGARFERIRARTP